MATELVKAQLDALCGVLNVGVKQAADVLNQMLESQITLQILNIDMISDKDAPGHEPNQEEKSFSSVNLSFKGPFSGNTALIFPTKAIPSLIPLLAGEIGQTDIEEVKVGILSEVGNIVLNGVMGAIGNQLQKHFEFAVPEYLEDRWENIIASNGNNIHEKIKLVSHVVFSIEKLKLDGEIILYFDIGTLDAIIETLCVSA